MEGGAAIRRGGHPWSEPTATYWRRVPKSATRFVADLAAFTLAPCSAIN